MIETALLPPWTVVLRPCGPLRMLCVVLWKASLWIFDTPERTRIRR